MASDELVVDTDGSPANGVEAATGTIDIDEDDDRELRVVFAPERGRPSRILRVRCGRPDPNAPAWATEPGRFRAPAGAWSRDIRSRASSELSECDQVRADPTLEGTSG